MKQLFFMVCTLTTLFTYAQTQPAMEEIIKKVKNDRAFFKSLGKIYPADRSTTVSKEQVNGVSCYWFLPANAPANNLIIYLHGGSFALGSIQSHQAMVSHLAAGLQTRILFIEYALAPEKPYPHGLHDVIKVYRQILSRYPAATLFFMGDSAGGGLLVTAIDAAIKNHLTVPTGVILLSPWLNLRCNNGSYETKKQADPILTKEVLTEYAAYYAPSNLNEADPSQRSFTSFPPVLLLTGSNEILLDDTKNFYQAIIKIQPHTEMSVFDQQTHVWLLTDIHSESSKKAIEQISSFIKTLSNG